MPALNVVVMIVGLAVAGLGLIGLVAPSLLLDFGRSLLTESGLYAVAAVRVVIGLLLVFAARNSRMPQTLRVLGSVIIIAGVLTPLFGVTRSAAMFYWLSLQGTTFVRVIAVVAIAIGAFVVYAIAPRRRSAV
jgi:hypothetical protein